MMIIIDPLLTNMFTICGGEGDSVKMNKPTNNKCKIVFIVLIILFVTLFFCHMPGYILEKCLGYPDKMYYNFWNPLDNFLRGNKVLNFLYHLVLYKIPTWTIYPTVLINTANMIIGFKCYKKKWWYYLLFAISVMCSVLLLDYYAIYNDDV